MQEHTRQMQALPLQTSQPSHLLTGKLCVCVVACQQDDCLLSLPFLYSEHQCFDQKNMMEAMLYQFRAWPSRGTEKFCFHHFSVSLDSWLVMYGV